MNATGPSGQATGTLRAPVLLAGLASAVIVAFAVTASAQTEPPAPVLVLEQLIDGQVRCVSTEAACTTVDLYAPDGERHPAAIRPGDVLTTTVQLRNAGTVGATALDLSAGDCRNEPLDDLILTEDLCAAVTVAFSCDSGAGPVAVGPQSLASFGRDATRTVAATLDVGASATCVVTTAYPAEAPPTVRAIRAVQPVTWTLSAPDSAVAGGDIDADPDGGIGGDSGPGDGGDGRLAVTGGAPLVLAVIGVSLVLGGAALRRGARRPTVPRPR